MPRLLLVALAALAALAPARAGLASSAASTAGCDIRYFVAGATCAAFSHGITTPIDVVKTRMQLQPEKYDKGVGAAALCIVKEEGVLFLLAGLGPTVWGYGIEGALKFGSYELFKPILANLTPSQLFNFILASVIAGGLASIVLCPMEEARIRMVSDSTFAPSLLSALFRMARENRLLATFTEGMAPMLAKQVPYTMAKQVTFDVVAKALYALVATTAISEADAKWGISLAAAGTAAVLACVFSQPGDMILTATYKTAKRSTVGEVVREVVAEHGLPGLFLGLRARLAHVGMIITSQLLVYDLVKQTLGLAATGK